MKLLVPLRSPNRFYLLKWRGQHCLDICKTYSLLKSTDLMAAQNHWPPKDWWLEYLGILHQHGPKSSQKKCISTFRAISISKCRHPVLHLWLPHFFGIFAFRNPTFLLLFMHLATCRETPTGKEKHGRILPKGGENLGRHEGFFSATYLSNSWIFRSGRVRRKNSTP